MNTQAFKIPEGWRDREVVALPEVVRATGVDRREFYGMVQRGVIPTLNERGRHNALQMTRDDAIKLVMALALAAAATIALATAFRAISAGATFPVEGVPMAA